MTHHVPPGAPKVGAAPGAGYIRVSNADGQFEDLAIGAPGISYQAFTVPIPNATAIMAVVFPVPMTAAYALTVSLEVAPGDPTLTVNFDTPVLAGFNMVLSGPTGTANYILHVLATLV